MNVTRRGFCKALAAGAAGASAGTAFFNANVPPVVHSETLKPSVGDNAYTVNEQGVMIVPLDVQALASGDVRIRAKDPAYANPGPEEVQRFPD